jgi:hypothetical protein
LCSVGRLLLELETVFTVVLLDAETGFGGGSEGVGVAEFCAHARRGESTALDEVF